MKKFAKDTNQKTVVELEKSVADLKIEIAKLQVEATVTSQKNTNLIGSKKKQLAVLLTILRQKKA